MKCTLRGSGARSATSPGADLPQLPPNFSFRPFFSTSRIINSQSPCTSRKPIGGLAEINQTEVRAVLFEFDPTGSRANKKSTSGALMPDARLVCCEILLLNGRLVYFGAGEA